LTLGISLQTLVNSLHGPPWLIWLVGLVLGLALLVKASDWFTEAAVRMGHHLGLPGFLIGVTIVALGTSLPELISSLVAVFRDAPEIVAGNVIGSNIANLLLVLGLIGVVSGHLRIAYNVLSVDLPFIAGSALFLGLVAWDGWISRGDALLCLAGFVIYFSYALTRQEGKEDIAEGEDGAETEDPEASRLHPVIPLVASGLLIYVGADLTIQSVIALAALIGLGTETIAASVVALGTSLPEVAVTLAAVRRGRTELAIGNILGSNIFNAFAVIGLTGLLGPLVVSPELIAFALPMMIVASFLAIVVIFEQELTKWEGWLLLLFYVFFLGSLFGLL